MKLVYALAGLHNFLHRNNNGDIAETDLEFSMDDNDELGEILPDIREPRNGEAWRMREEIADALWRDYCVIRGRRN